MTVFASLALGTALPPLAALATLSNLPAASTYLHLSQGLLGGIAAAVLVLSAALCIGIYRRRLPEQPYPDTRAVANLLVKRGAEPHQPDRMLISRSQVLLVEPVKADSQIAKLIAEQQAAKASPN